MEENSEKSNQNAKKEINMYNLMYYNYKPVTNNDKLASFKKRLEAFKGVHTLSDAKSLLDKTMPVMLERTVFYIGDAKCVIINLPQQLRICLKTSKEFILYHFM